MEPLTRRRLLVNGAEAAAGAALGAAAMAAPAVARAPKGGDRPNVFFVAIDDMNDWTGWQGGYPLASTPNLDRLAGQGVGLHRAYADAPVCQAARAAVLFGRYPWRTGIYTNACLNWPRVAPDRVSLVRAFKDAGYLTTYTGKIHHMDWRWNTAPNDPASWTDPLPRPQWADTGKEPLIWRAEGTREKTEDMRCARLMVEKHLSKRHDRPFFAAFGLRKPHPKWVAPQTYFDRFPQADEMPYPLGALDTLHSAMARNEDVKDLPEAGRAMARQRYSDHLDIAGKGAWKAYVKGYLACIAEADDAIGVALDGLAKGPNASNTIVVVWSDHGWQLGEKCTWQKFTLWERALRVPVIFAGPGVKPRASRALFSTTDLYKTLTSLAGVDRPDDIDGADHAAFLKGKAKSARDAVVSSWAFDVDGDDPAKISKARRDLHFSVRTESHRLIAYGNGDLELYDHRVDPYEWTNLAERKSERDRVAKMLERVPKTPAPPALGAKSSEVAAADDDD
ncbi:sulfatase [Chenggangzhangella methanolivorans]|uniref:Sulfatase n=1 Tax=Chenggangzhangella methanolivorans TaxID=1437009 RepID=A0A9E6RCX8_9HYPH|nr:sulfatase [Chenggangzhangella methanolivorans]QZO00999.1 sulfatase [Chenggangzhangella methanolivorans]